MSQALWPLGGHVTFKLTWKDKNLVSCNIHCRHNSVETPILLPHSTVTGDKG